MLSTEQKLKLMESAIGVYFRSSLPARVDSLTSEGKKAADVEHIANDIATIYRVMRSEIHFDILHPPSTPDELGNKYSIPDDGSPERG